jgi:hypothetical protein
MAKNVLLGNVRRLTEPLLCTLLLLGMVVWPTHTAEAALSAPLASYSFDRASNTDNTFFDETGNGNDCATAFPTGNVFLAAGHTNSALYVNSNNRDINCSNRNLQPTSSITVMLWLRSDGTGGFKESPVSMSLNGTTDTWKIYSGDGAFHYSAEVTTTNGMVGAYSSSVANTTAWHHVAFTYDGASIKVYVDGDLKVTSAQTGSLDYGSNTYPLKLTTDSIDEDWSQQMDDLRIFGTALSQSEIQQMMNTPVSNDSQHVYDRSISMSSAKPSASPTTYSVSFKASESYDLKTLIVDFCSNSPEAGQDCTAPGGFTVSGSPGISNFAINGSAPGGSWTGTSQNSGRTLVVAGSAAASISPGDVITFDITTVTNPGSVTSFFGRILTYSFAAPTYSANDTDNYKESGGTALATANGIGFVFQVPESLQFCVYKVTCGDVPDLILGHGPHMALDDSQIDTDTAKASISTNALNGATIVGYGDAPTLSPGVRINPTTPNGSSVLIVAGTEAFGIRIGPSTGEISANFCYRDSNAPNKYCFSNAMATTGTNLTRQATAGPISGTVLTFTFAATASKTTQAGTYTTIISLVAVGEY